MPVSAHRTIPIRLVSKQHHQWDDVMMLMMLMLTGLYVDICTVLLIVFGMDKVVSIFSSCLKMETTTETTTETLRVFLDNGYHDVSTATATRMIELLDKFRCPFTLDFVSHPVIGSDGFIYERKYLTKYNNNGCECGYCERVLRTSPITREDFQNIDQEYVHCHTLRSFFRELHSLLPDVFPDDSDEDLPDGSENSDFYNSDHSGYDDNYDDDDNYDEDDNRDDEDDENDEDDVMWANNMMADETMTMGLVGTSSSSSSSSSVSSDDSTDVDYRPTIPQTSVRCSCVGAAFDVHHRCQPDDDTWKVCPNRMMTTIYLIKQNEGYQLTRAKNMDFEFLIGHPYYLNRREIEQFKTNEAFYEQFTW